MQHPPAGRARQGTSGASAARRCRLPRPCPPLARSTATSRSSSTRARRARRRAGARRELAAQLGVAPAELPPLEVRKRSIDARRGRVRFHLVVGVARQRSPRSAARRCATVAGEPVVIVGAGPAGLFCAYELARAGVRAVVLDRGKPVQARRRDLKGLTQHGVVDPDSNYCFGEGGAGTYSDGKLYTRSHKRGDVRDVIEILALHGAPRRDPRRRAPAHRLEQAAEGDHRAARAARGGRQPRSGSARASTRARRARRRARSACALADGGELHRAARSCSRPATPRATSTTLLAARRRAARGRSRSRSACASSTRSRSIDRIQYGRAAGHPKLPAAAVSARVHADATAAACSRSACARAAGSCRRRPSPTASSSTA